MQQELTKNVPNMAVIDDRMTRTLVSRRQEIMSVPLLDLLSKYPALKTDIQVLLRSVMFVWVTIVEYPMACFVTLFFSISPIYRTAVCLLLGNVTDTI
jgi:hypothetical protein